MTQNVYTLLVEIGRTATDGLPKRATGGALICYTPADSPDEAVRETVAILKTADLAPLEVQSYGTLDERLASGDEVDQEERDLMTRAVEENSVVVAQLRAFYPEDDELRANDFKNDQD